MSPYGQFCPMSKAMDVLDERWTLLIIREMLLGSTHFNDLRRGVPKMSPSLLSKRLKTLCRAGVIERRDVAGRTSYVLTPCGRELEGVVQALMAWGTRWVGELGEQDLDPHLLMWDIQRTVAIDNWPRTRTVVGFQLGGVHTRASRWWLMVADGRADMCDFDPGYDVAAIVATELRTLTEIWRGDTTWSRCLMDGSATITGADDARRAVPAWLGQSRSAAIPRPA